MAGTDETRPEDKSQRHILCVFDKGVVGHMAGAGVPMAGHIDCKTACGTVVRVDGTKVEYTEVGVEFQYWLM